MANHVLHGRLARGGVEVARVLALAVGHLAGHGVAAVGQSAQALLEVEVGAVPNLHGAVVALVAPRARHGPPVSVARELGVENERRGVGLGGLFREVRREVVVVEAPLLDSKDLQAGNVVARLVAGNLLAVAVSVGGCPQAQPVAGVLAVLHGPAAVGVGQEQARPLAGSRLVVGAQLVGAVPLRLQQKSVVVDVAQSVGIAVGFDGEHLREVGQGLGGRLEEEGLVAVVRCVLQPDEQVGLVTGQHEIAVVGQRAEFLGRGNQLVALGVGEQVVVGVVGSLHLDRERIGDAAEGGRDGHVLVNAGHGVGQAVGAVAPRHVVPAGGGGHDELQRHLGACQHFDLVGLSGGTVGYGDGLLGRHHVQLEAALADGSALVDILAGVGTAGHEVGNSYRVAFLSVIPKVVVAPAGGGAHLQDNRASAEHRGLGSLRGRAG